MPDAVPQGLDRDLVVLVDLARLRLLDPRRGELDLDDMRAELGGDVRGVGHHVHRGLPVLAQPRAPGIRPDHDREPRPLGLLGDLPELLVHLAAVGRARVDGVADPAAPEANAIMLTLKSTRTAFSLLSSFGSV